MQTLLSDIKLCAVLRIKQALVFRDNADHYILKKGQYIGEGLQLALGHSQLTFGPEFYMYTCIHAFARLISSHHTVKVHDVTTKHCAPIDKRHAPEKIAYFIHIPAQK